MRNKPVQNIQNHLRITASNSLLYIGGFILIASGSLMISVGEKSRDWSPAIIVGCCALFFVLWWRAFLLTLEDGVLSYRTLFGGTKKIKVSEISRLQRNFDLGGGNRPTVRMEVYGAHEGKPFEVDINIKVFPLEPVKALFASIDPSRRDENE